MAFKDVLIDFAGWTNAHGVPRIGGAANNIWRCFWILVTVGCTGMLGYNLYMVVTQFISYPVSVSPSFEFISMDFPGVTVCNLNSFMLSKVFNISTPFGYAQSDYNYQFAAMTNNVPVGTTSPLWPIFNVQVNNDSMSLQNQMAQSVAYAANVVTRAPLSASPTLNHMILSCMYDTVACKSSDWTSMNNYFYNNCYKYNCGTSPYLAVRAGPANGLRLLFRTDQLDYLPWVVSAGAKVMIHNANENPFPVSFGYTAPVGVLSSYSIKRTTKTRLPSPYGACTTVTTGTSKYYYNGAYTIEGCLRSCLQDTIIKTCGCGNAMYSSPAGFTDVCNFNDSTKYSCALSTANTFDTSSCSCPEVCAQNSYTVTVTTATWPAPRFIPSFCYKTPFIRGDNSSYWFQGNTTDCVTWAKSNTGMVEVFYETLDARDLQEAGSYVLLSLISDFGGQMGLWIGGSFIVVFELITFIVLIVLFCVSKCMRCGKGKAKVAPEEKNAEKPETPEQPEKSDKAKKPNDDMYTNDHGSDVIPPAIAQGPS